MNMWKLIQTRDGISQTLEKETETLNNMYTDSSTTAESRQAQANIVKDLTERLSGVSAQIAAFEREVSDRNIAKSDMSDTEKITKANAALIRNTIKGEPVTPEIRAALKDDTSSGGGNLLPSTLTTQIITAPKAKNPLRKLCQVKNITNLKMPKIGYSLSNDGFVDDGATARELAMSASIVSFGRYEYKVFADVTDTIINGTDTNLVVDVNAALYAGIAKKEKKVAFAATPATGEEHMSFYSAENNITEVEGANLYAAIKAAIADLEDEYADSAAIVMKRSDYLAIVELLANGNAALYTAQPESVLGVPVVFCDLATKPIVGDFSYAVYNYEQNATFERDKNVKSGVWSFVVTCQFDFRILMSSAFRIAKVSV